jgi:hypothetical protein
MTLALIRLQSLSRSTFSFKHLLEKNSQKPNVTKCLIMTFLLLMEYRNGKLCLRLKIDPPYPFQIPTQELNELGLPDKKLYTTGDICQILELHPDTFRYRLRSGIYPEAKHRAGDKRRFTYDEVAEIVRITKAKSWPKYKSKC